MKYLTHDEILEWSINLIRKLEWKRFEDVCAYYFRTIGYRALMTSLEADGGIDIKLYKNAEKVEAIVQCKAWNALKVGIKEIRELYGIMAAEKVRVGIVMTSGEFTEEAIQFKKGKNLILIDGESFLKLINRLPENNRNVLLNIAIEGDFDIPTCPSCGIKMKLRIAKKGKNTGNKFWGCRNYPRCKRLFNIGRKL